MPHVVNFKYADMETATAGAAMNIGDIGLVTEGATGDIRQVDPIGDTDDLLVLEGNVGVVIKFPADALEVATSTAQPSTGDRVPSIATGDLVVLVGKGAILEYDADELDDSLNPGQGGTTPTLGDDIGISSAKFSDIATAVSAGIAVPVIARVHKLFGTKVQIKLVGVYQ